MGRPSSGLVLLLCVVSVINSGDGMQTSVLRGRASRLKPDYPEIDPEVPDSRSPTPTNAVLFFIKLPGNNTMCRESRTFDDFPVQCEVKACSPEELRPQNGQCKKGCRCKERLDCGTDMLVKWARGEHNMATGVVMACNKSTTSIKQQRESDGTADDGARGKRFARLYEDCRNDRRTSDEGSEDLYKSSTMMRQMFLGPFMHSLGGMSPEEFRGERENGKPELACMVRSTIQNLQDAAIAGCKGFLLLVKAEGDTSPKELDRAVKAVINTTDPTNTLFVVTGLCPEGQGTIKLYAKGPNSFMMKSSRLLPQVPKYVKEALCRQDPPTSSALSRADDDELRNNGLEGLSSDEVFQDGIVNGSNAAFAPADARGHPEGSRARSPQQRFYPGSSSVHKSYVERTAETQ